MTKRTVGRRSNSSRSRRTRRTASKGIHLDASQLTWLAGVLLLGVALVTFLSLMTSNRGAVTEWWIRLLFSFLGLGTYAVPLLLLLLALALLTHLTDVPFTLSWSRFLGGTLLLLTLLGFGHHLFPSSRPGGILGVYLSLALETTLGWGGAIVIFAMLLGIALTLTLRLSLEEIVEDAMGLQQRGALWLTHYRERKAAQRLQDIEREPPPSSIQPSPQHNAAPPAEPSFPKPVAPPVRDTEAAPVTEDIPAMMGYDSRRWALPPVVQLLAPDEESSMSLRDIREKTRLIEETLISLGVPVTVVEVNPGPVVTQFGLEPGYIERRDRKGKTKRVKIQVSKIASLSNDLALALAAAPIRIEAPVPGKGIVGIEVPNKEMATVGLRSVMESDEFLRLRDRPLAVGFGRDVSGSPVVADLASLPHLLIAGSTGSGKSVSINALIACLLCRNTPDDVRLLMVDPKRVELSNYNGIPHLIAPVVVDPPRVVGILKWLAAEMDRRYRVFAKAGARNLQAYNKKAGSRGEPRMPYIVMFIDELADLMMVAPDEVERQICRIAQLSRATGIHLVIATQRPSVDVVTGLIKANFPARLSFLVSSQVDSRVIIDTPGAEKLLGQGDALYMAPDSPKLARIQGCFVSDAELERLVSFWRAQKSQQEPVLSIEPADPKKSVQKPLWPDSTRVDYSQVDDDNDPLIEQAVDLVVKEQRASVSFLQRGLRIGYSRAARMIDTLEERGIIGPATGSSKARDVLIAAISELRPEHSDDRGD